jgi:phosphatidylglycerophosphate synthase
MKKIKEEIFNIQNILTFMRLVFGPVCFYLILTERQSWALFLFVLGAMSDKLDGIIARKTNRTSLFGATFDPVADNMLILCTAFGLIIKNIVDSYVFNYLLGIGLILLTGAIISLIKFSRIVLPNIKLAKINGCIAYFLIIYIFLGFPFANILINLALIFSFFVAIEFLVHNLKSERKS